MHSNVRGTDRATRRESMCDVNLARGLTNVAFREYALESDERLAPPCLRTSTAVQCTRMNVRWCSFVQQDGHGPDRYSSSAGCGGRGVGGTTQLYNRYSERTRNI